MEFLYYRRWIRACLLIEVVAFASSVWAAPPWFVRTWQSDEGLPDNTVMGVAQTPDGFLWVATKTGLARFDGVQFRQFPVTAPGAMTGNIKTIVTDRSGCVWVAKDQGVVVCVNQGRTTTVIGQEHADTDTGVRVLAVDAEGAVWVSYLGGEVLRIQDGQVRSFTAEDGLPEGGLCRWALDGTGCLWFSKGGWVGVFQGDKFRLLKQIGNDLIAGAREGGLLGYSGRQFWKYTEEKGLVDISALPASVPIVTPTALREDPDGCLWLGTAEAGLYRVERTGATTAILQQQTILNLTEDREGSLWVGTRGGGLSQLKPRVAELLTTGSAIPFQPVRSVCQDTDGGLWAVAWPNGEVMRSVGQGWTLLTADDGWNVINTKCVAADPRGGVWIGTEYAGLFRWQGGAVTERHTRENGLGGNRITALLTTPSGDVWISILVSDTQPALLQCRSGGRYRTFTLPPESGSVVALATDSADDCWAATGKGRLLRVRGATLSDETAQTLAEPMEIRCLLGTPDGSLWIGYGGQGLGRLKAGRFSRCRIAQGLRDDYISNMLPDGLGRLWFAGNRGIFSVREKALNDFMDGRAARVWSVAYGRSDGLLRLQASFDSWPGAVRGTEGRLFFAMQSGVAAIYAAELKDGPALPSVVLEEVRVNGVTRAAYGAAGFPVPASSSPPVELGQVGARPRLSLPAGHRRVEFAFTAPTSAKPESIGVKYRLGGLDQDWVEAGASRQATYAQLPPGHYRFEVRACNSDGVWNNNGAALELTAEPYWWETGWFRLAGPLAVAGLLGGWIYLWLRRRQRIQLDRMELLQATERERVRIARDLHDDLGAGLTEIAMLSELVRRNRNRPDEVNTHVQRIFLSSSEMTQALDEIVWAVNPVNDTLDKLVSFVCESAQAVLGSAGIRCRLDMPDQIPEMDVNSQVRHQVCMALKECLSNVVKHARAREVTIRIGLKDRLLDMTVEDDGAGFDPAVLPNRTGTHDGLINMRHRLAEINGICEIRSAPGQGTRVLLYVRI